MSKVCFSRHGAFWAPAALWESIIIIISSNLSAFLTEWRRWRPKAVAIMREMVIGYVLRGHRVLLRAYSQKWLTSALPEQITEQSEGTIGRRRNISSTSRAFPLALNSIKIYKYPSRQPKNSTLHVMPSLTTESQSLFLLHFCNLLLYLLATKSTSSEHKRGFFLQYLRLIFKFDCFHYTNFNS